MMTGPVNYHYGRFPPTTIDWDTLRSSLGTCNRALGRLDGQLDNLPNPYILTTPLLNSEALSSSRIEGTQATLLQVLEYEAKGMPGTTPERRRSDFQEVLNYRKTLVEASDRLKEIPLCQRLIKQAHKSLLKGVRGSMADLGHFRKIPNWIGKPGCSIDQASYVPIDANKLVEGMNNWESFLHTDYPEPLVKLAILHAEFEALHPFLDGNGRLGRMLVPLFLYSMKIIERPIFYISAFFEENREQYYHCLQRVSSHDDWTTWCAFFLLAVHSQALTHRIKVLEVKTLYEKKTEQVLQATQSKHIIKVIDFLFSNPVFSSTRFAADTGIPKSSSSWLLKKLQENAIIREIQSKQGRKAAVYMFDELVAVMS